MLNLLGWIFLGVVTAFIILQSMEWSVRYINPEKGRKSMIYVIGGTIMRWLLISIVLVFSLSHSTLAGFIVFGTFFVFRSIFLLKWQGWLRTTH